MRDYAIAIVLGIVEGLTESLMDCILVEDADAA